MKKGTRVKKIISKRKTIKKMRKGGELSPISLGDQNSIDSSINSSINSSISSIDTDLSDISLKSLDREKLEKNDKTPIIKTIKKYHKSIGSLDSVDDRKTKKILDTLVKQSNTYNKNREHIYDTDINIIKNNIRGSLNNKFNAALETEFLKYNNKVEKLNKKIKNLINMDWMDSVLKEMLENTLLKYFDMIRHKYSVISDSYQFYNSFNLSANLPQTVSVNGVGIPKTELNLRISNFKDKISINRKNNYISERDEYGMNLFDYLELILKDRYNYDLIESLEKEEGFNSFVNKLKRINNIIKEEKDKLLNENYFVIINKKLEKYKKHLTKKSPEINKARHKSITKKLSKKINKFEEILKEYKEGIEKIKNLEHFEKENKNINETNIGDIMTILDRSPNDFLGNDYNNFFDTMLDFEDLTNLYFYHTDGNMRYRITKIPKLNKNELISIIYFMMLQVVRHLRNASNLYHKKIEKKYKLPDLFDVKGFNEVLPEEIKKNILEGFLGLNMNNNNSNRNNNEILSDDSSVLSDDSNVDLNEYKINRLINDSLKRVDGEDYL